MALDFPASPIDGQVFGAYTWNAARGVWLQTSMSSRVATTSDAPPASPTNGDMWMYTVDGTCFIYYNDGTSGQWVEQSKSILTPATYQSPNVFINGGFDIWQRGTSSTTTAVYIADRWIHSFSAGTATVSRSTDTPSGIFAEYSLSFASTSGTNPQIQQRIESFNAVGLAGQTVTLSLYAKATVGTGGLSFSTGYASAVDNFTTITTDVAATALTASMSTTGGWVRYSATFVVNANAVNGYAINIFRNVTTTSTTTLYSGIQLELGSVATSFRRNAPSIQAELAACQRYYQFHDFIVGSGDSAGYKFATNPLGQLLRATPTVTATTTGGPSQSPVYSTATAQGVLGKGGFANGSGATAGAYVIFTNVIVNAEL